MINLGITNPQQVANNFDALLDNTKIKIVDPITKGFGLGFDLYQRRFNEYWTMSLAVSDRKNCPLFKKLHENSIHIQNMPFIMEHLGERTELIQIDRVRHVKKESNIIIFTGLTLKLLDNIQFMRAISKQRRLNNE